MRKFVTFTLFVGAFCFASRLFAATDLTLLRSGVGVTGNPQFLSGQLDVNGNGHRELLVADQWHVSLVEEDANPRGYREVERMDAPTSERFTSALLIDVPGIAPALLLRWGNQFELRDAATSRIKAAVEMRVGDFLAFGDVDGEGSPEIVALAGDTLELFDPVTLESRGSVPLPVVPIDAGSIAIADVLGDARGEIVLENGNAYTLARSGSSLSLAEVWSAGIPGPWLVHALDIDGHAAIVLDKYRGGGERWLATFVPTPSLRLLPVNDLNVPPLFADANGDGRTDAIYTSDYIVGAVDIASGATLWERNTIYAPPYVGSIFRPTTIDLDGDGASEIAWADAPYDSGVVAMSLPPLGAPRWSSDWNQSHVIDWTTVKRADGSSSIAYLTRATITAPRLSTLGFLDSVTLADQGGSTLAWLADYNGFAQPTQQQSAITSLPLQGHGDAVIVAGATLRTYWDEPFARWLWTFDGSGALLTSRTIASSTDPQRIVAAQVLNRPERQLVVAGSLPLSPEAICVEIVDYEAGTVLWRSAPLPTRFGTPVSKLEVADLNADGRIEIVVAHGENVTMLTPEAGTDAVVSHTAEMFSLLGRGAGRNAKLATLHNKMDNAEVAVFDGLGAEPEKTFVLPSVAYGIALFAQAPNDELMFATGSYGTLTVQRYADAAVVAKHTRWSGNGFLSIAATDLDGDRRIDIIGSDPGLRVWRLENDYIFRAEFDSF